MKKREKIKNQRLEQLEAEFRPLLVSCLEECARGRYGLFGHNEHLGNWWYWDEAERLKEIAREIINIKLNMGSKPPSASGFYTIVLCAVLTSLANPSWLSSF